MKKGRILTKVLSIVLCMAMTLTYMPMTALASDCSHVYDADGICTNCSTPAQVAVITDETAYYESLQTAVDAVSESTSSDTTVKVLEDIALTAGVTVFGGVFTLDLNGKTVSYDSGDILAVNGGDITIDGDGTIIMENVDGDGAGLRLNAGKVTLKNGKIASEGWRSGITIDATDGATPEFVMYGGIVEAIDAAYGIFNFNGTVTLNTGTVNGKVYTSGGNVTVNDITINGDVDASSGTLNLESGTITSNTAGVSVGSSAIVNLNGKVEITSGYYDFFMETDAFLNVNTTDIDTYSVMMRTNGAVFAKPGDGIELSRSMFTPVESNVDVLKNENGELYLDSCTHNAVDTDWKCTACDTQMEASVTTAGDNPVTTYYEDLDSAASAAEELSKSTVKLLADITLESPIYIYSGEFTIDLNGHDVISYNDVFNISGESDTIYADITFMDSTEMDGKVIAENYGTAVCVEEYGKVTINGGTFIAEGAMVASDGGRIDLSGYKNPTGITITFFTLDAPTVSDVLSLPEGYAVYDSNHEEVSTFVDGEICTIHLPHVHNWSFEAEDNTIYAECENVDGYCPDVEQFIRLLEPSCDLTYDGKVKTTVTDYSIESVETPVITYCCEDGCVDVGEHTASISIEGVTASITFEIEAAIPEIMTDPVANELTYNGKEQALVTDGTVEGGTLVYSLSEDGEYTDEIPTATGAGEYTVWYYVKGDANHTDSAKASVRVTIAKREITVTADAKTKVYGEADPILTYAVSGLVEGETLTGTLTRAEGENAGEYEITQDTLTNENNPNYDITFVGAKLTINKAASTLTKAPTANTLTYNGEAQALVTAGTAEGGTLVYGLSENGEYTDEIPTAIDAGEYTVWYYVKGDANHTDSAKASVKVVVEEVLNGLIQAEDGTWYYYVDGEIASDYTGLVEHYGSWYYVENGVLNWNYTGLTNYYGTWYYVEGGVLNWNYTGLTEYYGTWYYVEGGILNWNYTGLTEYYGAWYYVEGGVLNWNYTGLTLYYDTWYYVEGGVLNWSYTGLTLYYDVWYYVEGGVLNFGYTGLVNHYGTWYYVEGGILNWNYTGLSEYYGAWYYVEGGVLNFGYTGLVYHYGTWYYVGNGVLDWTFTGNVYQYGTWWYVENGILVGAA